jgi:hypothetical protein
MAKKTQKLCGYSISIVFFITFNEASQGLNRT